MSHERCLCDTSKRMYVCVAVVGHLVLQGRQFFVQKKIHVCITGMFFGYLSGTCCSGQTGWIRFFDAAQKTVMYMSEIHANGILYQKDLPDYLRAAPVAAKQETSFMSTALTPHR